jgi:hypothetical protein
VDTTTDWFTGVWMPVSKKSKRMEISGAFSPEVIQIIPV